MSNVVGVATSTRWLNVEPLLPTSQATFVPCETALRIRRKTGPCSAGSPLLLNVMLPLNAELSPKKSMPLIAPGAPKPAPASFAKIRFPEPEMLPRTFNVCEPVLSFDRALPVPLTTSRIVQVEISCYTGVQLSASKRDFAAT